MEKITINKSIENIRLLGTGENLSKKALKKTCKYFVDVDIMFRPITCC